MEILQIVGFAFCALFITQTIKEKEMILHYS